jgi:anhydro-N-acetylmuramic acid kinase
MIRTIEKLLAIGKKETRTIIGLMSGTSLDGLDIALCKITGEGLHTKLRLQQFISIPYTPGFKSDIRSVLGKNHVPLADICLLNKFIAVTHAQMINQCLEEWNIPPDEVDLIASHGQTIYHAPFSLHEQAQFGNATLQIGDGDHLSVNTGIITISDFRQKNIAAGGEGAPLAAYGDFLLFSREDKDRVLLNIGGISNFTFLPAGEPFQHVICSDTGPGNTLMDAWIRKKYPGLDFDTDASIAKQGRVNEQLLSALLSLSFFKIPVPKTTGPELFSLQFVENALRDSGTINLPAEDVLATLNRLTAFSICQSIEAVIKKNTDTEILMSGGGIHNPLLVAFVKDYFPGLAVHTTADCDVVPDAKEAILFALLANEMVAGNESTFGKGNKGFPGISMGKISFPG